MHRSGTSFLAHWLAQCGLNIGQRLIPGDFSNPAGHHEDQVISQFQRRILRANALNHLVTDEPITVDPAFYDEARALLMTVAPDHQWGWKDPRTALLLDFWQALLPHLRVVVIYRPAHQVVDSLLRREAKTRLRQLKGKHPRRVLRRWGVRARFSFANVALVRQYARVWQRYNADALRFVAQNPQAALVITHEDVLERGDRIIEQINQWGFALQAFDARQIYQPDLMHTSAMRLQQQWVQALVPGVQATQRELEAARQRTLDGQA